MRIETTESRNTDPSSPNPDSEYDTASDSHSEVEEEEDDANLDEEDDDLEDDEDDEIQEIDDSENEDDGSIVFDLERQRGDGQETDAENKKKVDDDEDRSNPQYIPKKGTFYEHDDRTADDGSKPEPKIGEEVVEKVESPTPSTTKATKKWQSSTGSERWSHDRFDAGEQAPKSRSELVSAYGYDIRNEDGPPRARRRRRYGRGPTKYTRKWEDEGAYGKTTPQLNQQQPQRKPRPEDFPALGSRSSGRRNPDESFKENNSEEINKRPQNRNNYQDARGSPGSRRPHPRDNNRGDRKDRGNSGYSGRNTIEFKNQNRNKNLDSPSQHHQNQHHQGGNNSNNSNSNRTLNNQDQNKAQFEDAPPIMESMSFTNTKIFNNNNNNSRSNNDRYSNDNDLMTASSGGSNNEQVRYTNRNSKERDRPSNLSGRTQVPQRNQNQINTHKQQQSQQQQQQQPQQTKVQQSISQPQIQTQQQPQTMPLQQQSQQPPQIAQNTTAQITNVAPVESSRPKRYSSQRQKSTTDNLPQIQQQQQQPMPKQNIQMTVVHDQVLLQEQNIMQNNLIQDKLNYPAQQITQVQNNNQSGNFQQIPLHLQNELIQTNTVQVQQTQPQMISGGQYQAQFTQPAGTSYIQGPGPYLPQPAPQIINYVPTIPATQTQYPAQFSGYPNYPPVPPTNQASAIYQTQSGLTYYAPQTQTQPRPILPQRRPTNAIPILAPPERGGRGRGRLNNQYEDYDEQQDTKITTQTDHPTSLGSAENIDHILDNMFVQRPAYQPPPSTASISHKITPPPILDQTTPNSETILTTSSIEKEEILQEMPAPTSSSSSSTLKIDNEIIVNEIENSVKELSIKEDILNPVGLKDGGLNDNNILSPVELIIDDKSKIATLNIIEQQPA